MLIGQMRGGSWQKKKIKSLCSTTIIHLLNSDQFVLINPHEDTVSETKAPGGTMRTTTSKYQRLKCTPPHLPVHCGLLCLPRRFQSVSQRRTEPKQVGYTPERVGEGGKKCPFLLYKKKKKCPQCSFFSVVFRSLHQSTLKQTLT